MKFKVGDIVKLKEGLVIDEYYNDLHFRDGMQFKGKAKIVKVDDDNTVMIKPLTKNYGHPIITLLWYGEDMLVMA